jgi:hypothetical protein
MLIYHLPWFYSYSPNRLLSTGALCTWREESLEMGIGCIMDGCCWFMMLEKAIPIAGIRTASMMINAKEIMILPPNIR